MVIQTDMKSKRVRNVLIGISALVILAAIGAGGLELYFRRVFGPGIDPRSSQGVQALVQIAGAAVLYVMLWNVSSGNMVVIR